MIDKVHVNKVACHLPCIYVLFPETQASKCVQSCNNKDAHQIFKHFSQLVIGLRSYITATTIAGASLFWEDALVLQQRWNAAANGALGVLARNGCWSRAMHMAYRDLE